MGSADGQEFNNITARILYTRVITDDLPGLINGLSEPPAHEAIRSKDSLLSLVKHLFLEYADRNRVVTYTELFAGPVANNHREYGEQFVIWQYITRNDVVSGYSYKHLLASLAYPFKQLLEFARSRGIDDGLQGDPDKIYAAQQSVSPFTLTSLSLGGILGGDSACWRLLMMNAPKLQRACQNLRLDIYEQLVIWARTQHICWRANEGPLGLPVKIELELAHQQRPHMTVHMNDWDPPCFDGRLPTEFVYDTPLRPDGDVFGEYEQLAPPSRDSVAALAGLLHAMNRTAFSDLTTHSKARRLKDRISWRIYRSHALLRSGTSDTVYNAQQCALWARKLQEASRSPALCALVDITLHPIHEAPECPACGGRPDLDRQASMNDD